MGEFVGRAAELARVRRFVARGRGGLAVVVGPAGIGKTALVDELADSWAMHDRGVLRARAVERTPRFGWLERLVRALGAPHPGADRTLVMAGQERELADLLATALSDHAPAVLVLEDAHWADESSKRVVADVVDDLSGVDVVVVVTCRDRTDADELEGRAGRKELVLLQPFDDDELAAMFESARRRAPAPEELSALRERTGGVPLLVEEMLAGGDGRSPAVRDVLAATLSGLSAESSAAVSLLAVAGPGTPTNVLAAAATVSESSIVDRLDEAASVGVLDEERAWFRHGLFADAARDLIDGAEQRALHVALATAWGRMDPTGARVAYHLVAAVPAVDPDIAVDASCAAAASLRAAGRPGDAADVLDGALTERWSARLTPRTVTRLLLEVGEARWELGDTSGALDAFRRADRASRDAPDVELSARAAVAAQRRHNPFVPDLDARARLAELDHELGDGDSAIRVEVLGRRSVLATQPPSDLREAEALATEAVAMARRLGDPGLIVGALRDRFLCCRTPGELDARADASQEILAMARRTGSPDWLLVGHEWHAAGCLGTGDLAGAARTITELAATATVMRSSHWQMSALLRRAPILALLGDRDEALDCTAVLSELVETAGAPHEVLGAQIGLRSSIAMLYGRLDAGLPELLSAGEEMFDAAPSSFLQIAQSSASVLVGDLDAARRRAMPWLADPATALDGPSPLSTLSLMAECVVQLGLRECAPPLIELLEPFRGRNCMDLGTQVDLPVDHRLACLALLVGDHQRAVVHALAAVDLGRRMGAPPVEARSLAVLADTHTETGDVDAAVVARDRARALAEPIGLVLDAPRSGRAPAPVRVGPVTARRVEIHRFADGSCRVRHGDGSFELAPSRGVRQLVRLVAVPGADVSAVELAGHHDADAVAVEASLGPVLDARAKRDYRRRIMELNAEIDDADSSHDLERAARARIELETVIDELRRATGLGGRDRPQRSGAERARVNVTRSLRRAIAAVERHDRELGAHLQLSVRTGRSCSYRPDPSSTITIEVVS